MADMAHISGLVAAHEAADPFQYCHVVTTTTHKTLRGPRAGLIFFRKDKDGREERESRNQGPFSFEWNPFLFLWALPDLFSYTIDLEARVNFAVFPSCQGGPHDNTIAAVAVALKQANCPEFREYAIQIRRNSSVLAESLRAKGYTIVTDGTDNHIVLWDLRPQDLTGNKLEKICEMTR
jgi:glycine hydroxymethyltransferase